MKEHKINALCFCENVGMIETLKMIKQNPNKIITESQNSKFISKVCQMENIGYVTNQSKDAIVQKQ